MVDKLAQARGITDGKKISGALRLETVARQHNRRQKKVRERSTPFLPAKSCHGVRSKERPGIRLGQSLSHASANA